jgi:DNA polymerase
MTHDDDEIARPGAERWIPATIRLGSLRSAAEECRGCELWHDATRVVFSEGKASATIMLVGEQPGDREDRAGEPFVGPAGELLDDALAEAKVDRKSIYLTNAVKHFRHHTSPSGKRRLHDKPGVVHITACHPWLAAELKKVAPEVIVCLGATASRAVLGRTVPISSVRGTRLDGPPDAPDAAVFVTTHPSAVLRLRGKEEYAPAFDLFVDDLARAADVVRGRESRAAVTP